MILYLHGGGYACGDLEYAMGFASTLSVECGSRVFAPAYRLAPEHPFPAALDDALTAYSYLLDKGYPPQQITLCGESAGGGLCYALCLRIKASGIPLPGGVIVISPWTDLTLSGESHDRNRDRDPSLTAALLDYFASCYTSNRADPLVSPLLADLQGMPPSLIIVGSDEILLDDARLLHEKLLQSACTSQLVVAPQRWHGCVLYNLSENRNDYNRINQFLNRYISPEKKLRWLKLDNAAKIYPASRNNHWSNIFRLSATLTEPIDAQTMTSTLDITVRRFPSIAARLRKGLFWYYLEQIPRAPAIRKGGPVHLWRCMPGFRRIHASFGIPAASDFWPSRHWYLVVLSADRLLPSGYYADVPGFLPSSAGIFGTKILPVNKQNPKPCNLGFCL